MKSFTKEERLCNLKLIEGLFHNGSSFLVYPYRVVWQFDERVISVPAQILIGVPKKRFKRAVDRNLLKRRMREAYRTQKAETLYPVLCGSSRRIIFSITFIGNTVAEYSQLEKKMGTVLRKLAQEVLSHVE